MIEEIDRIALRLALLERKHRVAVEALKRIAKPALGGKQQQYAAQDALREIGEGQ